MTLEGRAKSSKRIHNTGVHVMRLGLALIVVSAVVLTLYPSVLLIIDGNRDLTPFEERAYFGALGVGCLGIGLALAGAVVAWTTHRSGR